MTSQTFPESLQPLYYDHFPLRIKCLAYNYLTQEMMVITKDDIHLFDIAKNFLIQKLPYRRKFSKLYESEIKIKSLDSVMLQNLWIALVNFKSFIFFDSQLRFSRIYSPE